MGKTADKTWPQIAFEGWSLATEAGLVMWLRGMRLMAGGKLAEREARRMVEEKVSANLALLPAMMMGGLFDTQEQAAHRALAHYRKPVRANRRRLTRR